MTREFAQRQSGDGPDNNQPIIRAEARRMTRHVNVLAEQRRATKRTFGEVLRAIRESTPPLDGIYRRSDCQCMTQCQLADELGRVIEEENGQPYYIETTWINKVECGRVWVDPYLVRWIAKALGADKINTALLLEAHGYNGVAELALELQGQSVIIAARPFEAPRSDSRSDRHARRKMALAQARDLITVAVEAILAEHIRKHESPDS